jgi:hypothetical protein
MLFFKKKEDSLGLPDLPPSQMPNIKSITREIPASPETVNNPPTMSKIENKEEDEDENEDDNEPIEKHALPSFPDTANLKGFSQTAIKDAVGTGKEDNFLPKISLPKIPALLPKAPEPSVLQKPVSLEEWNPEKTITPKPASSNQKSSSIYVKLEKFHTAKRALEDIKSKVEEVESLLGKIREVKMREEQELSGWEKDVFNIKSRLQDVTDNIFERGD